MIGTACSGGVTGAPCGGVPGVTGAPCGGVIGTSSTLATDVRCLPCTIGLLGVVGLLPDINDCNPDINAFLSLVVCLIG